MASPLIVASTRTSEPWRVAARDFPDAAFARAVRPSTSLRSAGLTWRKQRRVSWNLSSSRWRSPPACPPANRRRRARNA